MLLRRLLLTKEIEVYEIKNSLYGEVKFYMIFVDFKRPSRTEDFPNIDSEDFTSRGNFIKAIVIFDKEMSESEEELTYEIASGFLENKDDCDWNMKYIQASFENLKIIGVNETELIKKINDILQSAQIEKKIERINLDSFRYLLQY